VPYPSLVCFPNLTSKVGTFSEPWLYDPGTQRLADLQAMPKPERRKLTARPDFEWQIYSEVRGVVPTLRVGSGNEAQSMAGLSLDYDLIQSNPDELIAQMSEDFRPNFLEYSLSGKSRLLFLFERPILCMNSAHCSAIKRAFVEKFKLATAFAGFDEASLKAEQVWTNGANWIDYKRPPIPWKTLFGVVASTAKTVKPSRTDIPLEKVAAEIEKRWPGRWQGPFELSNLGVRFWDPTADNPSGCQIKPDGMLCFTGNVAFMSWEALLGTKWCDEQSVRNLGEIAADIAWDGQAYYILTRGRWRDFSESNVLLHLSHGGLSPQRGKGQTISDAHRVLYHIQQENRVDQAGPFVCRPPGFLDLESSRVLNTCHLQPVVPAPDADYDPNECFPLTWEVGNGLFGDGFPNLLAHHQRAYDSFLNYRPTMGQAIYVAGEAGSGKTLWCLHIFRPLLGWRSANPIDHLTDAGGFNSELFEVGLLAMNDEDAPSNEWTQARQLQRLKGLVVNPEQTCHPKYKKRAMIIWTGRIFATLNKDLASLGGLPEINSDTRDKFMFFEARKFRGRWGSQAEVEAQIARERPFWARYLIRYQPPKAIMIGGRTGVESYFSPSLLKTAKHQNVSHDLHELLVLWARTSQFMEDRAEWVGTPTELFSEISGHEGLKSVVQDWNVRRVAKHLTTLARMPDSGVVHLPGSSDRKFKIVKAALLKN